jgi:hypothetical protein
MESLIGLEGFFFCVVEGGEATVEEEEAKAKEEDFCYCRASALFGCSSKSTKSNGLMNLTYENFDERSFFFGFNIQL